MASRFIASFIAFSLATSLQVSAEQYYVSNEREPEEALASSQEVAEKKDKPAESKRPTVVVKPAKAESNSESQEKASTEPKKTKPHFAGVRRPAPKVVSEKKKSSKIKNQWFSSKTHPKVEKKEVVKEEEVETIDELPADGPFYIRNTGFINENNPFSKPVIGQSPSANRSVQQQTNPTPQTYPQTGFQAPRGHIYLTADYLLWRTRQEGMEFATNKKLNFEFGSGFRAGFGVHLPEDGWDLYADYTHFYPESSRHSSGSFYPLFLFQGAGAPQGPSVSKAEAHWNIKFQDVDLEIGRAYYIAKTLTFRPFIGLKGAWIEQHAKFHYEGGFIPAGQIFRTHFQNDFKGAGPLIGIDSNWQLGAGFSLFGDLSSALVVGHFDNKQKQYQLNGAEVVDLKNGFNLVSATLQMIAGVAWDINFNRDQCHFGLSAGFETQYWWSQNQTELFTDKDFPIYTRQKGGLAFYGLTARIRFDF
jgi:hypothetical protein